MKIIKQLIEKKLQNERELSKSNIKDLAIMEHISAYMMALAFLNFNDELLSKKSRLWKRFFSSTGKEQERNYRKIMQLKAGGDYIIMKALNEIEEVRQGNTAYLGSLYRDSVWGILSYEHETSD